MTALRRCWDLSETHLKEAVASRQAMGKLLREMADISQPDSGAPKILIAIARLAKPSTDWIDGALRVEIEAADDQTRFTIMEDLGGGMREVLFPRLVVNAPLAEFDRSLRLAARAVAPLQLLRESGDKLVLTNKKVRTSHEPPSFEVAEDCLRRSFPPAVRKSVAPPPPGAPPPPAAAATPAAPAASAPTPAKVAQRPQAPKMGPPPLPKVSDPVLQRRVRASKPPPAARAAEPPPPKRSAPEPPRREEQVLEIPRVAKFLDFGDFDNANAAEAEAKAKKKPSRGPPRP